MYQGKIVEAKANCFKVPCLAREGKQKRTTQATVRNKRQ